MHKNHVVGTIVVALLAGVAWWAWLGWDTEKTLDAATGSETGPYEAWQVIGSALCVVVLVVVATRVWGPIVAALGTTVGYTLGWVVTAFSGDDQGLALIGAVLVLVGVGIASTVIAALTRRLTRS